MTPKLSIMDEHLNNRRNYLMERLVWLWSPVFFYINSLKFRIVLIGPHTLNINGNLNSWIAYRPVIDSEPISQKHTCGKIKPWNEVGI